jgi:hypothetical protein
MVSVWQSLSASLTAEQQADMDTFGYALLGAPQYNVLYGRQGVVSGIHHN